MASGGDTFAVTIQKEASLTKSSSIGAGLLAGARMLRLGYGWGAKPRLALPTGCVNRRNPTAVCVRRSWRPACCNSL